MLINDVRNDYEIIEGVKFMAPSPGIGHGTITANLIKIIGTYASINKLGICFGDHMDVHFPDGNLFQPDFIFVSADKANLFLGKRNMTLHGVPDMVAEIFSHSTMKRDMTIKKDIYERNGVKEYWIVNHVDKTVQVYHLINKKYELDHVYHVYTPDELAQLEDYERADVKYEIKVSIFDDLIVDVGDIFYNV